MTYIFPVDRRLAAMLVGGEDRLTELLEEGNRQDGHSLQGTGAKLAVYGSGDSQIFALEGTVAELEEVAKDLGLVSLED